MNNIVKVVSISSGVNANHSNFAKLDMKGINLIPNRPIYDITDNIGLGTAVSSILKTGLDYKIEIFNVKVVDKDVELDETCLINAMKYIAENIVCDIINISVSVNCWCNCEMERICNNLTAKGIILVASFSDFGGISYPAAFDSVIGVDTGRQCTSRHDFEYVEGSPINVKAFGKAQHVAWIPNDSYNFVSGNSYACAHVSNYIAALIVNNKLNKEQILTTIKKNSTKIFLKPEIKADSNIINYYKKIPFNIQRASLFPINKETSNIIRNYNLLTFELIDVYDIKYSARIGKKTSEYFNKSMHKDFIIKDIDNIEWEGIDTLIVGHIDELEKLSKRYDLKEKLIFQAQKMMVNIVIFDNCIEYITKFNIATNKIYWPQIINENIPKNRFGKLHSISKPVLSILGTGSKQGKFTLQLYLRSEMEALGIKVGQLGTEPNALLFGFDAVYPMGYNSSVYVKDDDAILTVNNIMYEISKKENDLIIVGSQANTIPYDYTCVEFFPCYQTMFLYGTLPDAVILCINSFDEYNFVKRNIDYLQSVIETSVIAIVIFPMTPKEDYVNIPQSRRLLSNEEMFTVKRKNGEKFKIPVYISGIRSEMKALTEYIINYFS